MTTPRRVLPLRITLIITSFLAAFTSIAVFAAAGVTVNVEVKETGGETVQQKIHIVGQTMKMDVAGDRNGSVIFRVARTR